MLLRYASNIFANAIQLLAKYSKVGNTILYTLCVASLAIAS